MKVIERSMSRQAKFESIRAACIQASPDITELRFGCELKLVPHLVERVISEPYIPERVGRKLNRENARFVVVGSLDYPSVTRAVSVNSIVENAHILGRPIRLADVLLAIQAKRGRPDARNPESWKVIHLWNLRQDALAAQSDQCIDCLYELLQ
jgi:hypothetical protein